MKSRAAVLVLVMAAAVVTVARSGHELPVYPSYYPHEIQIERVAPERAATLLSDGKMHAYVGSAPRPSGPLPESIRPVESLGAFVTVRVNPQSPLAGDPATACAVMQAVLRDIAGRGGGLIFHPYPVTPFHGDYLHHVDLAEAAKARLLAASGKEAKSGVGELKVKATGAFAESLVRPQWRAQTSEWDAAIEAVSAADLLAAATFAINGWLGPPWVRNGWFHAYQLLTDKGANGGGDRTGTEFERLRTFDHAGGTERINLERALVAKLTAGCRAMVAGYTVKREYVSTEFSAGIENIAYDSIAGLASPMFIRTVKLKDFPWNGWLALGIDARPEAAWNPIAGFTDPFGRLTWYALGDPAAIPSPYDSAWVLNRISGVESAPRR